MNKLLSNLKQLNTPASASEMSPSRSSNGVKYGIVPTLVVAVLALATIVSVALFGTGLGDTAQASDPVRRMPVRTQRVEFVNSINQVRKYTGDVRARQTSDLGFELSGRISKILVDEGDQVEAGQALAVLDTRTLEARHDATQASLNQAIARLDELEAGPRQETIEATRAKVDEAKAALQLAKLNFNRREKLWESDAISTEEFQSAKFGLEAAEAVVNSAKKQLEELVEGTRDEQKAAQRAVVQQLQASLKEIAVQIDKSELAAPFAGRIVKRMADPGRLGLPSQPILRLIETQHLEAIIGLPADVASKLHVGDSIFVSVHHQEYPGKIKAKIQQLEMATRTQNVLIEFDSVAGSDVLPGQLCQIELSRPLDVSGYWVPASSLTNGIRGLWSLMTVDDESRARRQDVEVIYTDADRVLVRGALSADAFVISEGTHRIVDGQPVEVVKGESLTPERNAMND